VEEATRALHDLWRGFAEAHCRGYSPLYEQVALAVSADKDLLELVRQAPPSAHMPPALLAAVHYLLLAGLDHPLADVYAGRASSDPGPLFRDVCLSHREEVAELLATRHIQTNDCGRCSSIGVALTYVSRRLGPPLALVDVGTSAGLNLLCDRYRLDYGSHGATGPEHSPVKVECSVLGGQPPVAAQLPPLAAKVGIDRSPIDLTDPADARWLLACVWPDTGRLERTAAAIEMGRQDPPTIVRGRASDVLLDTLDALPDTLAAMVTTTWVFGYFTLEERPQFVDILAEAARRRPVIWVSAEAAGTVGAFADVPLPRHEEAVSDVLGLMDFDAGEPTPELLGFVQPHGRWIDWRAG